MGKHMQIHSSKKELQQREELQEQLQTVILKNKVLYKTWDDSSPNLRNTWIPSCFFKFMGNSVAIPFQMLE